MRIGLVRSRTAVGKATDSSSGDSSLARLVGSVRGLGDFPRADEVDTSQMQQPQPHEWRRYGFGGPPEPWEHGAQRDLDRLATSYYVDILESQRAVLGSQPDPAVRARVEDLLSTATRHKHEIDYTLRHWATPVERARIEDRLGSLMRIGMRLREIRDSGNAPAPATPPRAKRSAKEPLPTA